MDLMDRAAERRALTKGRKSLRPAVFFSAVIFLAPFFLGACTNDSAKKHYVLAEKLWKEEQYAASITEFEKVIKKDPKAKLGLQSLFRVAMTQTLFLGQHQDAIKNFEKFTMESDDESAKWVAQKQIGEILFSKLRRYDQAISYFQMLAKLKPKAEEVPEFLFKEGKGYFFLRQFEKSVDTYQEIVSKFPDSPWTEKANFEKGVSLLTFAEQKANEVDSNHDIYKKALEANQEFVKKYPKSLFVPEAKFGIATALEEMDQLDAAYAEFESLKGLYPSPRVIEIKLYRLAARKAQKNH